MDKPLDVKPQEGFQEQFLSSPADIVIGGGSAGAGKTFAGLIEPLRNIHIKDFGAIYFRRTFSQIKNTGALWDQSMKLYPYLGAVPNETTTSWKFPSGATVRFSHLQHEKDVHNHQGAEYPLIIFDELQQFTEFQFWYLLSRNRSVSGVRPKCMGTCNPDPDSFLARLIDWWLDPETGLPLPELSGRLRYFIRHEGQMIWGNSKQDVLDKAQFIVNEFPEDVNPFDLVKSFTFIPGDIYGNKVLMKANPEYLANLLSQDADIKEQLLKGNWKIRVDNTALFNWERINDLSSNHVGNQKERFITCDAARFGRDLMVIMVWQGWEVVHIEIMKQSDVHDIVKAIEALRKKFGVSKSSTLVDQDGVGAGTVRKGGYKGFSGGAAPKKIRGLKENYKNLKTQCFYYLAEEKVNPGDIRINVNNECCVVDGIRSTKIKIGGTVKDITDLIREDLRAIKRAKIDIEGKTQINTKDEQKVILGRSPDFGDCLMMRSYFEYASRRAL